MPEYWCDKIRDAKYFAKVKEWKMLFLFSSTAEEMCILFTNAKWHSHCYKMVVPSVLKGKSDVLYMLV